MRQKIELFIPSETREFLAPYAERYKTTVEALFFCFLAGIMTQSINVPTKKFAPLLSNWKPDSKYWFEMNGKIIRAILGK